ncbi:hypothetical protein HpSP79_07360 [Helicobacter pylori]
MKNIKTQLFAALIGLFAAAAPAAETAQGTVKVFEGANYTVIHETLPKGKEIPPSQPPRPYPAGYPNQRQLGIFV